MDAQEVSWRLSQMEYCAKQARRSAANDRKQEVIHWVDRIAFWANRLSASVKEGQ